MKNWILTKRKAAINLSQVCEINYAYHAELGGWNVRAYFPFTIEEIQEWVLLQVFETEEDAVNYISTIIDSK